MGEGRTLGNSKGRKIEIFSSGSNKDVNYFSHDGYGQRFTNGSKAAEMIVRETSEVSDMFSESIGELSNITPRSHCTMAE